MMILEKRNINIDKKSIFWFDTKIINIIKL